MVGGDRNTAAELGRMKGELEAIEQVSIRKNCRIQFRKEGTEPVGLGAANASAAARSQ